MEMASNRPQPTFAVQDEPTTPHPVRGPHGGWQKQEIDALTHSIQRAGEQGESLRSVFDRMGQELGRKPNSIRNFYYAQVRAREEGAARALPFETFSPDEVERLIERVLTARAQGMSVRACVRELAQGDHTRMLRYQNKYRSTVRTRPELVRQVMQRLSAQGIPFVSPYAAAQEEAPSLPLLQARAAQSGDAQLTVLFSSLNHLLDLALAPRSAECTQPAVKERCAPAVPFPADSDAMRRADRLSARCDVLRIALDDEQTRRAKLSHEAQGLVTLLKEYIALSEADRLSHCGAFCRQATVRMSAMECAMECDTECDTACDAERNAIKG